MSQLSLAMMYNGLQCYLVALNLLLCFSSLKCDSFQINAVIISNTTGDTCPTADVLANALKKLRESVNGVLTSLSATESPTTATTETESPRLQPLQQIPPRLHPLQQIPP